MKVFATLTFACFALAEVANAAGITLDFKRDTPDASKALAANKQRASHLKTGGAKSFAEASSRPSYPMFNSIWSVCVQWLFFFFLLNLVYQLRYKNNNICNPFDST